MGQFPSFWQLQPSEGIQPVPLQQRVLDFTPLLNSLNALPSTTTSGKKTEDDDIKFRDMRLGYARQLFAKGDAIKEKMRAMESIYGTMVYDMPAYQQMERDYSDNFSFQNQLYGALEKEKIDRFDKNIADQKASGAYHLEAYKQGLGLRKMSSWSDIGHNTESPTLDPTSRNARWSEEFPFDPKVYTEQDADTYLDQLFNPAAAAWFKTGDAGIIGDYMAGAAMGTLETRYTSGNNFVQLKDAEADALRSVGLMVDDKGNISLDEFKGIFDVSNPITGGYLQGFLQSGTEQGDGIYIGKTKIADIGDKGGLTEDGGAMFASYVARRINSHMEKRMEEEYTPYQSFRENSDYARSYGAGAQQLDEYLDAATKYYTAETLTEETGYTFDSIIQSMILPRVVGGNVTTEMAQEYMKSAEGQELIEQYRGIFNETFTRDVTDQYGTVLEPALLKAKRDVSTGQIYYELNEQFLADYEKNKQTKLKKLQDELAQWDGNDADSKIQRNNVLRKINMFNNLSQKIHEDGYIRGASQTRIVGSELTAAYEIDAGAMPDFQKQVGTMYKAGTKLGSLGYLPMMWGSHYNTANHIPNAAILNEGTPSTIHMQQAPGFTYFGEVKAGADADAYISKSGLDGVIVKQGNKYIDTRTGQPWVTSTDQYGRPDNGSYQAGADGRLKVMSDIEKEKRMASSKGMAAIGNPQAHVTTPTASVMVFDVGINPEDVKQSLVAVPTPFNYDKSKALAAYNDVSDIIRVDGTKWSIDYVKAAQKGISRGQIEEAFEYVGINDSGIFNSWEAVVGTKAILGSRSAKATAEDMKLQAAKELIGSISLANKGVKASNVKTYIDVPTYIGEGSGTHGFNKVWAKQHNLSLSPDKSKTGGKQFTIQTGIMVNSDIGRVVSSETYSKRGLNDRILGMYNDVGQGQPVSSNKVLNTDTKQTSMRPDITTVNPLNK